MDLTREQILEMTETIARACGMDIVYHEQFRPYCDYNDAMLAAYQLEVGRVHIDPEVIGNNLMWAVRLGRGDDDDSYAYVGLDKDTIAAFFRALHEAAKAKLEGYQQEDGN